MRRPRKWRMDSDKDKGRRDDGKKGNVLYALSLGSQLGLMIAAPLVVCLLLGIFLDKQFNTAPMFLLALVIFSIIATIFDVYYIIMPFIEKRSQKNNKDNNKK